MFFFEHFYVRNDTMMYFRASLTMKLLNTKRFAVLALTIAVIAVIFMQSIAVFQLKMELRQVKWAMKTQIIQCQSSENLQSFSFSNTEWNDLLKPDPTEFVFQGHYYDIAFVYHEGNGVVVKCLKDEHETLIKKQLKSWMDQEDSPFSRSKEKGNVYKVLSKIMLPMFSSEVIIFSETRQEHFFKASKYSFLFSILQFRPPIG